MPNTIFYILGLGAIAYAISIAPFIAGPFKRIAMWLLLVLAGWVAWTGLAPRRHLGTPAACVAPPPR